MSPLTTFLIAVNAFAFGLDIKGGDVLWAWINGGFVVLLFIGGLAFEREGRAR